jgi:hypothetical protein
MAYLEIEVSDFLSSCRAEDIDELIDALIEDGYLNKNSKQNYQSCSPAELDFQTAITKLNGKWNMLTEDEERAIIKIASRF